MVVIGSHFSSTSYNLGKWKKIVPKYADTFESKFFWGFPPFFFILDWLKRKINSFFINRYCCVESDYSKTFTFDAV